LRKRKQQNAGTEAGCYGNCRGSEDGFYFQSRVYKAPLVELVSRLNFRESMVREREDKWFIHGLGSRASKCHSEKRGISEVPLWVFYLSCFADYSTNNKNDA
jgi:hypothetical protein